MFRLLLAKGTLKEDAEDIIQNTFYKVYLLIDELTESNLRPWFFRVALNENIDLKRKKEHNNLHLSEDIYAKLQHAEREIAAILGIQVNSVKQKLYRARKFIQTKIG